MPRRWLSLLALLLLAFSAQAVADGDGEDHEEDERDAGDDREADGGDHAKRKGKHGDEIGAGRGRGRHRGSHAGPHESPPSATAPTSGTVGTSGAGDLQGTPSLPDAGLQILPTALRGRVQFSFLVATATAFDHATLTADLPDVGARWTLGGPAAEACTLTGLRLACHFEGPLAGEVQLVQASAPVGRAPAWELVAEGRVRVAGGPAGTDSVADAVDAIPGNDRPQPASASCLRETDPTLRPLPSVPGAFRRVDAAGVAVIRWAMVGPA
ncbi:MAG TPA: hypothetical protein VM327_07435 [Candidatus Thermoplasmatota archaeon]|nr:hypothetical protein [Candidatus Thermoplasmatota archaeon]